MSWKTIKGRRYYYKSKRVGGRVESRYFGAGATGYLIAEMDAVDRLEKAAEREENRAERDASEVEEQAVAEWFHDVQAVADAAMAEAGFHKHRGLWRRKRK